MPRKRIVAPKDDTGEINHSAMEFEDMDDIELEDAEDDENTPAIRSKGVEVVYQERSITRTFVKQKLTSGGRLTRYFTPETHGKNYQKLAEQFITTMKEQGPGTSDPDASERPRYVSHREV